MKQLYRFLIVLFAVFFFYSCQKEDEYVPVSSISLDQKELTVAIGKTVSIVATVNPSNSSAKRVLWSSSNPEIAKVDDGLVTGISEGHATIHAKIGRFEKTCAVSVFKGVSSVSDLDVFFSKDNRVITAAGGSEDIVFETDKDWSISISPEDNPWLAVTPSHGRAGSTKITITSSSNSERASRIGAIKVKCGQEDYSFNIKQRANVFYKYKGSSGTVTNAVTVNYSGLSFSRLYTVMPVPQTCLYQDITDFTGTGTVYGCKNNGNKYLVNDASYIPSGGDAISETFHVQVYGVSVDFSLIDDIPEFNKESELCREYLKDEEKEYVTPSNPLIIAYSNELWAASDGLVDYARRCYEWTAQYFTYGNAYGGLNPVGTLLDNKIADCDDMCSVYISLLRAKGIPSRHLAVIQPLISDFHVIAEFYLPGYGWIPVDPTYKNENPKRNFFGVYQGGSIAMDYSINSIIDDPSSPQGSEGYKINGLHTYEYYIVLSSPGTNLDFQRKLSKFN